MGNIPAQSRQPKPIESLRESVIPPSRTGRVWCWDTQRWEADNWAAQLRRDRIADQLGLEKKYLGFLFDEKINPRDHIHNMAMLLNLGVTPDQLRCLRHGYVAPDELRNLGSGEIAPGIQPNLGENFDRELRRAQAFAKVPELLAFQSKYFVIKHWGGAPVVGWYDADGHLYTQSPERFAKANENVVRWETDKDGKRKAVQVAKEWLAHPDRIEYERADFVPGRELPPHVFNMWRGWPTHMQRPSRKAAPLFNDFVFAVVCGWDLEVYEWVIGWLADAVQNIDRTGETALVLRGGEGHGKNFFWNRLRELFGREHTMMVSSADALVGHFNSHLMNKTMVFANEAAFTKTMDQAGALRSLITDDTMLATPKGVDSMEVNKCFRVIFASNHDHIVQMSADDRRYCVLDVDAGDHRRDRDFFGEIYRAWNEGEREEFLWQLWHHDLASWDPNAIPETEARTAQKAASLPPPWAWLRQLLSGDIPFDAVDPDSGHVFVFSENIPKSQAPDWTRAIKAVGGATGKVTANGRQERGRWFPTRMDAMRRFHDKTGVGRDWLDQHHVWFSEIGDHPTGTSRARDVI